MKTINTLPISAILSYAGSKLRLASPCKMINISNGQKITKAEDLEDKMEILVVERDQQVPNSIQTVTDNGTSKKINSDTGEKLNVRAERVKKEVNRLSKIFKSLSKETITEVLVSNHFNSNDTAVELMQLAEILDEHPISGSDEDPSADSFEDIISSDEEEEANLEDQAPAEEFVLQHGDQLESLDW